MVLSQAWPTYLFFIVMAVGTLLLLLSFFFKNLNTIWQIVIALIPFIAAYIYFDALSASKDKFLIPKGFIGEVTIRYNKPGGQDEKFEGRWRVYKIPSSGTLETKFKLKGNSINLSNSKYYYLDSTGNRFELRHYCEHCPDKDTIAIQVIYGVLGKSDEGTYQTFSIGSPIKLRDTKE